MNTDKYIYYIYQKAQGNLGTKESGLLAAWLGESQANRDIENQILESLESSNSFNPSFNIDVDGDYSKVLQRIQISKEKEGKGSRNSTTVWILGIFVLLSIIAGLVYTFGYAKTTELQMYAVETGINETKIIELADGTEVVVNELSKLSYPNRFGKDVRTVQLSGEAYFDVAKNPDKAFIIESPRSRIEVLGTAFNIRDINTEDEVMLTVEHGKVRFGDKLNKHELILTANQEGILDIVKDYVTKIEKTDLNALAWQTKTLSFRNAELDEVFRDIERYYSINIDYPSSISRCKYSMTNQQISITDLLESLSEIFKFTFIKESDNTYKINGGVCS